MPGVGAERKKILLKAFGSLKGIENAELEELKSTSTISFAELVVLEQEFLAQYSQFKTVTNAFMERIYGRVSAQHETRQLQS